MCDSVLLATLDNNKHFDPIAFKLLSLFYLALVLRIHKQCFAHTGENQFRLTFKCYRSIVGIIKHI